MSFLDDNILLESELAQNLYFQYAKELPIVDYHCHLNPQEIYSDIRFKDITHLWLAGDHYKWRLMRNCGVDERLITGDADSYEKFEAFCKIMPLCIGNPIYIWCHLELKKYFGYEKPINIKNCKEIYDLTKQKLATDQYSSRKLIEKSNVKAICTTDDPIDNLEWHTKISCDEAFKVKVLPSFRPDKTLNINDKSFIEYIKKLESASNKSIKTLSDLKDCLSKRLVYFVKAGCKVSDHAILNYTYLDGTEDEVQNIFQNALNGQKISSADAEKYMTNIMLFLAAEYKKSGITMQLHFCSARNLNEKMFNKLGPDAGYDSINLSKDSYKLAQYLDKLEKSNNLPKTIVYSLDPSDNRFINTVINCFQGDNIKGKLQHGSAWWFNDSEKGMKEQISMLAEYGVLGNFIGMLTDSRSFTSYVRHDYFRRILCNFIAKQVNQGKYPNEEDSLKVLIEGICINNVVKYLDI